MTNLNIYSAGQRFRYTYYDESQGEIYRSIEHLDKMVNLFLCPFLLVTHLMSDIWGLQCNVLILLVVQEKKGEEFFSKLQSHCYGYFDVEVGDSKTDFNTFHSWQSVK